jgi:hypothetical protein
METVQSSGRRRGLRCAAIGILAFACFCGCAYFRKAPPALPTSPVLLELACSATPESLFPGERLTLTATSGSIDIRHPLAYQWKTRDGELIGAAQSIWVATRSLPAGRHTNTGSVTNDRGDSGSCAVSFTIRAIEPAISGVEGPTQSVNRP